MYDSGAIPGGDAHRLRDSFANEERNTVPAVSGGGGANADGSGGIARDGNGRKQSTYTGFEGMAEVEEC